MLLQILADVTIRASTFNISPGSSSFREI